MSEEEILEAKIKLAMTERSEEADSSFSMTENGLFSEDCPSVCDPLPAQGMAEISGATGIGLP